MIFKDVHDNRWSAKAIQTVSEAGIFSGYPDGTFKPGKQITREEVAVIIAKMLFRDGVFSDILPQVMPSIVLIHTGPSLGSGASIKRKDGWTYLITNAHVVGDCLHGFCVKDDIDIENFGWELHHKDKKVDLAIVKTRQDLPPLNFAVKYTLGEPVAAIGSPQGFTESVAVGILSNVNRGDYLQIDAPISPGNSGGPVINEYGEIVGVTTSKLVDIAVEGMAFIIKAEVVQRYIKSVLG